MKYYCDGYTIEKNPSNKGGGYTIINEEGLLIETKQILKKNFTNNEAELLAVVNSLRIASNNDIIETDSWNTIWWIQSIAKKRHLRSEVARKDLNHLKEEAFKLLIKKKIKLVWGSREGNLAGLYNDDKFEKLVKHKHRFNLINGKFGKFYGCSYFPRCKITKRYLES